MDLDKSGLILKVFIKGSGAEFSANFSRPTACESYLKLQHLLEH